MLIKTLSIELRRTLKDAICIGLHPGTVDTGLSRPFQAGVNDGKLFSPDLSARRLLSVIDSVNTTDTGSVFAWDGQRVPE